jgi:multiple sugar transport system permease protein
MISIDDGGMPTKRRARAGRAFVAPNLAAIAVFMLFPL